MRFDKESQKIELKKRNFPQSKGKVKNEKQQKTAKVWPTKTYSVGVEAIVSRKTRIYKEKTKTIFETEK